MVLLAPTMLVMLSLAVVCVVLAPVLVMLLLVARAMASFMLGGSIKRVAEVCGVLKGGDAEARMVMGSAVRPAALSRTASRTKLLAGAPA